MQSTRSSVPHRPSRQSRRLAGFGSAALLTLLSACSSLGADDAGPIPGAERVDHLIQDDETHFAALWKLTSGGENAEGYWSFAGDRLVYQARNEEHGVDCDRIYVTDAATGARLDVSNGRGTTTCSYFLPDDRHVVFASTQAHHETCPPPPGREQGYVWSLWPEHDLWLHDLETGEERRITEGWGYDAEATVSPRGDRMVFTSTRSGDVELWTCNLDGSDPVQVTDTLGYDGGAFFSHDGEWLVFRTTRFSDENRAEEEAEYRRLLANDLVKPAEMEVMIIRADGTDRQQVTDLGKANWAPYFFPDDSRILFATNHHDNGPRRGPPNFDLFAIDLDGGNLERVTSYSGFDSFPMFSPDGKYLAFGSNRGGATPGETNLFVARWK